MPPQSRIPHFSIATCTIAQPYFRRCSIITRRNSLGCLVICLREFVSWLLQNVHRYKNSDMEPLFSLMASSFRIEMLTNVWLEWFVVDRFNSDRLETQFPFTSIHSPYTREWWLITISGGFHFIFNMFWIGRLLMWVTALLHHASSSISESWCLLIYFALIRCSLIMVFCVITLSEFIVARRFNRSYSSILFCTM